MVWVLAIGVSRIETFSGSPLIGAPSVWAKLCEFYPGYGAGIGT